MSPGLIRHSGLSREFPRVCLPSLLGPAAEVELRA